MTDIAVESMSYGYRSDVDAARHFIRGAVGRHPWPSRPKWRREDHAPAMLRRAAETELRARSRRRSGRPSRALIVNGVIGYVSEGMRLPSDMTLAQLERWLAPLHARWDADLARSLRDRFALDDSRRLSTLSRGEYVKAALLCILAARPRVLLMDEPLAGIDAVTKDEIVRGLLATSGPGEMTVLIAPHDIAEIESVLSHAVILSAGRVSCARRRR